MTKEIQFEYTGSGRIHYTLNGEAVISQPGDIVKVSSTDLSYSYFVENKRWIPVGDITVSEKKESKIEKRVKDFKEDLADDGKRNYSNDPSKKSPGRKKSGE